MILKNQDDVGVNSGGGGEEQKTKENWKQFWILQQ